MVMAAANLFNINSYIILDLETTGLSSSKITELSMLGVIREHLNEIDDKSNIANLPRVIQKINVCLYPNRLIHPEASDVSGLTNDLLEKYPAFNRNTCALINGIIDLLPKPVCVLAHNGIQFDFPILRSEIEQNGQSLPEDLLCADTLHAFRELLYKQPVVDMECGDAAEELLESDLDEIKRQDCPEVIVKTNSFGAKSVSYDVQALNGVTKFGDDVWGSQSLDDTLIDACKLAEERYMEEMKNVDLNLIRQVNETTPHSKGKGKGKMDLNTPPKRSKMSPSCSGITPQQEVKKRLSFEPAFKRRYRLVDCYEHLTRKPMKNAHQADADTHALLECVVTAGPRFLDWIDENCRPFNSIKKRW